MFTDEGIKLLQTAVIKTAIEDWIDGELGKAVTPSAKKEARKAWRFLNNGYNNLWMFTELEPEAVVRIAKRV